MTGRILIVGASGIIGRYCSNHLSAQTGWQITGLARRRPADMDNIDFLELDLLAPRLSGATRDGLAKTTHVVYAGFLPQPGADWAALTKANTAIFRELLDLIQSHAPDVARIVLLQGQKYYGSHLGPFKTPAKEDDPRHSGDNFYFTQQDLLAERAAAAPWDWICLRPHIICGLASSSPMNLILLMGVYASLCKELGQPLRFPGKASAYGALCQASDAGLLAAAVDWALTSPEADGQAFNITNGDLFRWNQVWPILADVFDMEMAPPDHLSLQAFLTGKAPLWRRMAVRHGLMSAALETLVDGSFGDYIFNVDWDVVSSTIKARQAGFTDCRDSETMFRNHFQALRDKKLVP